jgi:hypothetical protein
MNWLKCKLRKWLGVDAMERQWSEDLYTMKIKLIDVEGKVGILETSVDTLTLDLCAAQKVLNKYFRVDADVGYRGGNTLVLTGVYKNRGYVQFYDMGDKGFACEVERLKDLRRCNMLRHVDAPETYTGIFDLER